MKSLADKFETDAWWFWWLLQRAQKFVFHSKSHQRNPRTNCSSLVFKWMLAILGVQLLSSNFHASATFNLYLDRREFQKLHGISSDIYYIQEGVVNEYALNFVVTVPPDVEDLHFSWQALTKKPIHYDMSYDYTDFFALSQPYSNISHVGLVPKNLETFRVTLPCSGRSNSEVAVVIKIIFQTKYPKPNITAITIKRNKICLFKEMTVKTPAQPELPNLFPPITVTSNPANKNLKHQHHLNHKHSGNKSSEVELNSAVLFQDPGPSLLLAGLLGGCAVTASVVFLTFFVCLKRKLMTASMINSSNASPVYPCHDPNSSSNNSSPACLLRQSQMNSVVDAGGMGIKNIVSTDDNQMWKHHALNKETGHPGTIQSQSESHNSYLTVGSFWNELFSSSTPNNCRAGRTSSNSIANSTHRGSDVSPYAYAHIIPTYPPLGPPPPVPQNPGLPTPPTLIEWYSQSASACQSQSHSGNTSNSTCSNNYNTSQKQDKRGGDNVLGHIYANNLYSFAPLKYNSPAKLLPKSPHKVDSQGDQISDERVENQFSTMKSTSESLIQVDGFQCRRNLAKESNVVERFL